MPFHWICSPIFPIFRCCCYTRGHAAEQRKMCVRKLQKLGQKWDMIFMHFLTTMVGGSAQLLWSASWHVWHVWFQALVGQFFVSILFEIRGANAFCNRAFNTWNYEFLIFCSRVGSGKWQANLGDKFCRLNVLHVKFRRDRIKGEVCAIAQLCWQVGQKSSPVDAGWCKCDMGGRPNFMFTPRIVKLHFGQIWSQILVLGWVKKTYSFQFARINLGRHFCWTLTCRCAFLRLPRGAGKSPSLTHLLHALTVWKYRITSGGAVFRIFVMRIIHHQPLYEGTSPPPRGSRCLSWIFGPHSAKVQPWISPNPNNVWLELWAKIVVPDGITMGIMAGLRGSIEGNQCLRFRIVFVAASYTFFRFLACTTKTFKVLLDLPPPNCYIMRH